VEGTFPAQVRGSRPDSPYASVKRPPV